MSRFLSTKFYSLATGVILFGLGFIGFAFRNSFDIPTKYLIFCLLLGFWGLVISVGRKTL